MNEAGLQIAALTNFEWHNRLEIAMASAPYSDPSNSPDPPRGGGNNPYRGRTPRRSLNVSAIKSAIVFVTGAITALFGGLAGLGAQAAYAPMLTWMLGFAPEKAQGTAMYFGAWAAAAAAAGAYVAGAAPSGFVLSGAMLVVGAVLGAILCARIAQKTKGAAWRRAFQSLGIALTMGVILQVVHASGPFSPPPNLMQWHTPGALLLIGLAAGAVTQIMGLTSGALLVPALYFLTGLKTYNGSYAAPAVALSLFVISLASALPTLVSEKLGMVDTNYRTPITIAGLLGGFGGGMLLAHVSDRAVIALSAVIAMFLCARELSRLALSREADAPSS